MDFFFVRIYRASGNNPDLLQFTFCYENASFSKFIIKRLDNFPTRIV